MHQVVFTKLLSLRPPGARLLTLCKAAKLSTSFVQGP